MEIPRRFVIGSTLFRFYRGDMPVSSSGEGKGNSFYPLTLILSLGLSAITFGDGGRGEDFIFYPLSLAKSAIAFGDGGMGEG
ncbi:MAG: hypothetical protein IIA70_05910 [Proteobacteria bacterium]|nr:hypothetical protein [Pseudomonadota bacterium]